MDVAYCHRRMRLHGPLAIIPDALVFNRLHTLQLSQAATPALKRHELRQARHPCLRTDHPHLVA
jgi:hypothetical protein